MVMLNSHLMTHHRTQSHRQFVPDGDDVVAVLLSSDPSEEESAMSAEGE